MPHLALRSDGPLTREIQNFAPRSRELSVMSVYLYGHAVLTYWRVKKYKFIMTTLIKKVDDVRRFSPRLLVDVITLYDVIIRYRQKSPFSFCL